jgi:hypothetical protein
MGGLNSKKLIVSQFWRPEVLSQGIGRVGSLWGLCERGCPRLLFVTRWWLSSPCSFMLSFRSFMPVSLQISSFYKDTSHIGWGPVWPHLNQLHQHWPHCHRAHSEVLGIRISTDELGKGLNPTHNRDFPFSKISSHLCVTVHWVSMQITSARAQWNLGYPEDFPSGFSQPWFELVTSQ